MSAYSFGKVVVRGPLALVEEDIRLLASKSGVVTTFGFQDPEDEKAVNKSEAMREVGVVFNLFTPGEPNITTLYNEATERGRQAIRESLDDQSLPYSWTKAEALALPDEIYDVLTQTRLGAFIQGLFSTKLSKSAGLAIFDNGPERVIEDTPDNCFHLILKSLLVSWDLGPNALFVWKN